MHCFLSQPYDIKFKKRSSDTYIPAITVAGYIVNRVDLDQRNQPIMLSIKDGIRNAAVVLAEVTGNNPNVLHEVGIADGLEKAIILICEEEQVLPFNISHFPVIKYKAAAPSDFLELQKNITDRLLGIKNSPLPPHTPPKEPLLSQIEIKTLYILAKHGDRNIPAEMIHKDLDTKDSDNQIIELVLSALKKKNLVEIGKHVHRGKEINNYRLTNKGQKWILSHHKV